MPLNGSGVELVAGLMKRAPKRVVVITGAGCSTESGIPDYRSPQGVYRRPNFKPLMWQAFKNNENERRRYWLRSMLGYTTMSNALPNAAHMTLQNMSTDGRILRLITQNVDGLHHLAANGGILPQVVQENTTLYTASPAPLIELHGNIHTVACMGCGSRIPRRSLQIQMQLLNADLLDRMKDDEHKDKGRALPDGDFLADDKWVREVRLATCACGGEWRPDVVLFGENVAPSSVSAAYADVESCGMLLCCGTSLQVYSALRFVQHAKSLDIPIVIANHGVTRGDPLATHKVEVDSISKFLVELRNALL